MCNQLTGDVTRNYRVDARNYALAKSLQYAANSRLHKGKLISDKQREQWMKYLKESNPNKSKFGANSHLYGKKRSASVVEKIRQTKLNNPAKNGNYKGQYITPYGIFDSPYLAAQQTGLSYQVIYTRCKSKNLVIVTKATIKRNPDLNDNAIGSTFAMLGWGFLPLK